MDKDERDKIGFIYSDIEAAALDLERVLDTELDKALGNESNKFTKTEALYLVKAINELKDAVTRLNEII